MLCSDPGIGGWGSARHGGEEGGGVDGAGDGGEAGEAGADDGHGAEVGDGEDKRSCHRQIVTACSPEEVSSALETLERWVGGPNKRNAAEKYSRLTLSRRRVGQERSLIRWGVLTARRSSRVSSSGAAVAPGQGAPAANEKRSRKDNKRRECPQHLRSQTVGSNSVVTFVSPVVEREEEGGGRGATTGMTMAPMASLPLPSSLPQAPG